MTLLSLLLMLTLAVHGHPAPAGPVPNGSQAGHCDTLRNLHLSLQAAVAESGDTCQEVQALGD